MSKRQLLFVTYLDENLDEGFSYAVELAKAMQEGMALLLVPKRDSVAKKFEDLMAGVAFAEEGEHEIAQEIVRRGSGMLSARLDGKIAELVMKSGEAGVPLDIRNAQQDQNVVPAIRTFLRQNAAIDKVVLSPSVTESDVLTTRDLNRLVRTASRPIVTMTRQSVRTLKELSAPGMETKFNLEKEYA